MLLNFRTKNKIITVALQFLMVIAVGINLSLLWGYKYYERDFLVFYSSAKILKNDPGKLYDANTQAQYQLNALLKPDYVKAPKVYGPFVNLPLALVPFVPVATFDPQTAFQIIKVSYFLLSGVLIFLLSYIFTGNKKLSLNDFLINLSFTPVFVMAAETQTTLLYLYVLVVLLALLKKQKDFWSGFACVFLWISPQLAFLISAWLIICRGLTFLKGFVLGTIVFAALNLFFMNGAWVSFVKHFLWYSTYYEKFIQETYTLISVEGFFAQLAIFFPGIDAYNIGLLISIVITLICLKHFFALKALGQNFWLGLPVAITGTLLAGMHIHWHSTAILLILYWYYYVYAKTKTFKWFVVAGWIVCYLAFFSPFYPKPFYFAPTVYLVVLWFATLNFVKRSKVPS